MSISLLMSGFAPPLGAAPGAVVHAGMEDIAIVAIIFGTVSGVFYPIVRAWARRLEGGHVRAMPLAGVEERLDRIERGVEAMALEVERISEGQRFVTKLLTERSPMHLSPPTP